MAIVIHTDKGDAKKMKVIDLMPGIGARSLAFIKAGFEIVCAIDNQKEDEIIYRKIIDPINYILKNIQDVNPDDLPDADVVAGKLFQVVYAEANRSKNVVLEGLNEAVYNIIKYKNPNFFVLEGSISFLNRSNRQSTEDLLLKYIRLGYGVFYNVFAEREYSGYPISGKELFFVGIRKDIFHHEYYFPLPTFSEYVKKYTRENEDSIDKWYREIPLIEGEEYVEGQLYLREGKKIRKTEQIYIRSGIFTEMYVVDSIGLRRFTHNEMAWFKGIEVYDFNMCPNKLSMYMKIAKTSNVYIVEAIAKTLIDYINDRDVKLNKGTLIKSRKKKTKQEKVVFPKQRILNIHIHNLKGLQNVDIPIARNLTAIMGVNGSGKSTILHALACVYSPYDHENKYKFSFFFTPNPDSDWKNSSLELSYYDENEQKKVTRLYKKESDRWSPRYANRPVRDAYFVGIETCIPEIEKEKQTSFIDYSTNALDDAVAYKIIESAAYILNKDYKNLTMHRTKKKELLGVRTGTNLIYSSLSMGAGEQRLLKILKLVYTVNSYSLILIDEIDLLLHVTALRKLIEVLHNIALKKNLQIIFTTHSLEVLSLCEYVDIRYLNKVDKKTMVFDTINSDMIYDMNNVLDKPIEIFVEDLLTEIIIKQVAEDLNILRSIRVRKYGAASNAFVLAASYILKEEDNDNVLIILDGDEYKEDEQKIKAIKKILSGTEKLHENKIQRALSMIKQLALPVGLAPEKYVFDMLIEMDSQNEIVAIAKKLNAVADSHQWLDDLTSRMGQGKELILYKIINIVSQNIGWEKYIKDVRAWMIDKRKQLNLESQKDFNDWENLKILK